MLAGGGLPLSQDQHKSPNFHERLITYRGEGFSPSWLPLSSWLQDVAQLVSLRLGTNVRPHPFLDELEGVLVLGDLE